MRLNFLSVAAILFAIALVAFTKPIKKDNINNFSTSYFQFVGFTPQQTSDPFWWEEITYSEYNATSCFGTSMGCKIEVDQFFTWIVGGQRELWHDVPVINAGTANEAAVVDNWVTYEAYNSIW